MKALLIATLGACGASSSASPPRGQDHTSVPPDVAELRSLLRQAPDAPFDDRARQRGCPSDQSLHGYVAMLETQGSSGDVHRLGGGCGAFPASPLPIDPPADAAHWFCALDAFSSDSAGDSPWHYELHVRVRKIDRVIDLATLACPGV
jgi:hypothetical protein